MPRTDRFIAFDFEKYQRTFGFWRKLEMIFGAVPYDIDRTQGVFLRIGEMQLWRNLVAHSSPYGIEKTEVPNTTDAPRKLHEPFHMREYTRHVKLENAKQFYLNAVEFVDLLKSLTNIDPRSSATYVIGE